MNKTTVEQTIKTELPVEDSPAVIAYRVGKLEEAIDHGFASVNEKLDKLDGFLLRDEAYRIVEEERKTSKEAHTRLSDRLKALEDWKNGIVNKIAVGAIGVFVAMVLALYGLDKFL